MKKLLTIFALWTLCCGGARAQTLTTSGALQPPTAAQAKVIIDNNSNANIPANTNTVLAPANPSRIAWAIQCASGAVNVSETGATLASATEGAAGASVYIPTGSSPYFTPPIATLTPITVYTATAQACTITEYNR